MWKSIVSSLNFKMIPNWLKVLNPQAEENAAEKKNKVMLHFFW